MDLNILLISYSDPNTNPRPNRLMNHLIGKNGVRISLVSVNNFERTESFYQLPTVDRSLLSRMRRLLLMKIQKFDLLFWSREMKSIDNKLSNQSFDLIICQDLTYLPLAFSLKKNAKLIFDAREYFTRHFEDLPLWNFFYKNYNTYLVKNYMASCDINFTVSPGLAEQYKKEYDIDTVLFMSLPKYQKSKLKKRDAADNSIRMVHHGNATPSRHIEMMIDCFDFFNTNVYLDLYLVNHNQRYFKFLLKKAKKFKNVRILTPVPYHEINSMLMNYDIGLYLTRPTSFNVENMLPNKLFEFIQAGLAVCIGPNPSMSMIVKKYDCGKVSDTFEISSFAKMINEMSIKDVIRYKENSLIASKQLNIEENNKIIDGILDKISREKSSIDSKTQ